ncbi:MAG TPA: 2-oxoacid:ferredoxin oxidoreductase subunit beta, partial [Bryobacteraceae bacterium]|nr:2-oxoacid:ferredoxin oxidoreductase subunit beta [Bryobacteraceae bacterium]
ARLRLKKVGRDYDPTDKLNAVRALAEAEKEGHVLTGILYVDTSRPDFVELLNLVDEPLATLPESKVRPPREALDQIMDELR